MPFRVFNETPVPRYFYKGSGFAALQSSGPTYNAQPFFDVAGTTDTDTKNKIEIIWNWLVAENLFSVAQVYPMGSLAQPNYNGTNTIKGFGSASIDIEQPDISWNSGDCDIIYGVANNFINFNIQTGNFIIAGKGSIFRLENYFFDGDIERTGVWFNQSTNDLILGWFYGIEGDTIYSGTEIIPATTVGTGLINWKSSGGYMKSNSSSYTFSKSIAENFIMPPVYTHVEAWRILVIINNTSQSNAKNDELFNLIDTTF